MYSSMVTWLLALALCNGVWGAYRVSSYTQTAFGYSGNLNLISNGPYGGDIANLSFLVYYQTQDIIRIKIFDPKNTRWEVPTINQLNPPTSKPATVNYAFTLNQSPFGFSVARVSNGDVIFNTISSQFNPMIFEDQYLEISTVLPNNPNIYGLGERMTSLRLPLNNKFVIWNRDQGTPVLSNLYGTHPFYLEMRETGLAHGVFILNSNAQEFDLGTTSLTYKTIGGIFDMFIFLGPTPAAVVQQYHSVIGYPYLPPYWGLGWHQCRYGYHTLEITEQVVANYSKYNVPLDTMWNDIDYMDAYKDFTNDPTRYPQPQVRQFVQNLHQNGQHYIMIIDPGIAVDPGYSSYTQLLASHAFLKEYGTNNPIRGHVWPGNTYFPDFFHPNASTYWYNQALAFYNAGPQFDGMWIDMNEISNFCTAQCAVREDEVFANKWENPPYTPGGTSLDTGTINVTAQSWIGIEYDVHNLYGYSEGVVTAGVMEKLRGTRSVVISRSTFAGTGHHNGHWLGDNDSSYADLYYSIPGILTMQLFGVNFVGADICGFNGDTTEELCSRWMELGTLYPFSRNHNSLNQRSQEPWAFGPTLLNISIESLNRRYTLLPYLYTLFASAHFNATTVWRPLFFEFPNDTNTFGIDKQFLIGANLLVTPVLTQGATSVSGYFPKALWYSYYTGIPVTGQGQYITLPAPLNFIPIHVRAGAIIPTQGPALTTAAARTNPFGLLVALDGSGNAQGEIYLDDGDSLNIVYSLVTFAAAPSGNGGSITSQVIVKGYTNSSLPRLSNVTVFGVATAPQKVNANNSPVPFAYSVATKVLSIMPSLDILGNFQILWA